MTVTIKYFIDVKLNNGSINGGELGNNTNKVRGKLT